MISGTNGLLGAADGAFMLQKEKRTDNIATLEVAGRDQQDQKLHLVRDMDRLTWELERTETELWKAPPDKILDAVAVLLTEETPEWMGSPTELAEILQTEMKPNFLSKHLNVNAGRLQQEYKITYESTRTHGGRKIKLTLKIPPRDDGDGRDSDFDSASASQNIDTIDTTVTGTKNRNPNQSPPRRSGRMEYRLPSCLWSGRLRRGTLTMTGEMWDT